MQKRNRFYSRLKVTTNDLSQFGDAILAAPTVAPTLTPAGEEEGLEE
jgi:hypothetical protein